MSKPRFENHVWITFYLNNYQCLGRTVIIQGQEMVAVIDEIGNTGHLPFIEIENPVKITLIKQLPKTKQISTTIDDEKLKYIAFVIGEA